jgi:hypothetical protein
LAGIVNADAPKFARSSKAGAALHACQLRRAKSHASAATFDFGVPRLLFEMRAKVFNVRNSYVPGADGRRFLVNTLVNRSTPLNVVVNWQPR